MEMKNYNSSRLATAYSQGCYGECINYLLHKRENVIAHLIYELKYTFVRH